MYVFYSTLGISASGEKEGFGKFGASVELRYNIAGKFASDSTTLTWGTDGGRAWWEPNDLFRLEVGQGGSGGFGTMAGIDRSQDVFGGNGVKFRIKPIAGLAIGASAFSAGVKDLDKMRAAFGATYAVPDLLTVAANFGYYPDRTDNTADVGAGVNFVGLKGLGLTRLAADVATYNLTDAANKFYLGIGERIDYATGGLSVVARAQQFLAMGDALESSFIPMLFRGEISYKLSDIISLGVEGVFLMGRAPNFNWRNATEVDGLGVDHFVKDNKAKGLNLSPYVTFNVGPTIQVGYNLRKNLTDGATGVTQQNLIYATVNVNF